MERMNIWNKQIPGNSEKQKSEVMEIKSRKKPNSALDTIHWINALKERKYRKNKKFIDTYTATWVAKSDDNYHETFEDVPYLIPYIAEGSSKAVIVVPGGGYCVKEMENEGTQVAEQLQKDGITAFVLWYRTNPYYQPIPLMDAQRAVRFVRCYASKYGYKKDKIGAIGFSAGGALVSMFMNIYQGKETSFEGYEKDEIDLLDDSLNFAAMVYPSLSYRYNQGMLFASFPAEDVRDEKKREEIIEKYDSVKHMNSIGIPQFICYGTEESLVSIPQLQEYVKILRESNTEFEELLVMGADHGYGASVGRKYGYWLDKYIDWLKNIQ